MPEQNVMRPVFFGHGSPMNAIESNRYSLAWREYGASIALPRAVLAISAHWYIGATAVTVMAHPRTIHDFYGFPRALFEVEYPAPGDPKVAQEVIELAEPVWVGTDSDSWGLDHGTWSVLCHVFPQANVPVLQLSIDASKPMNYHFELGRKLAALADMGVLVLGSGNVVHNLRRINWSEPEAGYDWARTFNEEVAGIMQSDPEALLRIESHPDFALASPTPDHFLPLVYLAGMAREMGTTATRFLDGYAYGSLSMAAFQL